MDSIIPGREFQNKNSQKQKNRNCFLPDKVQLLYWVLDSQFLGNVCNAVLSVPVGYFTRLPDQRCVVQLTTRNFLKEDTNLLYYKIDLFEDLMYLEVSMKNGVRTLYKLSRHSRNEPWPNRGIQARSMNTKSILQAMIGSGLTPMIEEGARVGLPSVSRRSISSWRLVSHSLGSPIIKIASTLGKDGSSWYVPAAYTMNIHTE